MLVERRKRMHERTAQAIEETLKLARRADELGYHRYWLAEHHAIGALADPCPEILLTRVASARSC